MRPYYQQDGITIYHGDCREILASVSGDVLITDPPYPKLDYGWPFISPETLGLTGRQFWFWMNLEPFPLTPTALHIWAKSNVYIGDAEQYEVIYEVAGRRVSSVIREPAINSQVAAAMSGDVWHGHPCQKPQRLMRTLIRKTDGIVLDPFMGSGTTLVAAKRAGRRAVGIEVDERYCAMAVQRLAQAEMFGVEATA